MACKDWQHPYVNIFKHIKVEEWKRSSKVGDVSTSMNKTLKCSVFRIRAPVPANSYILVPKNIKHSLGLTGRYFYLLFRPTPGKYFIVHLDVSVKGGLAVRISFSNMFKEFKSTPTWLQFPFLCAAANDSVYEGRAKTNRHGKMQHPNCYTHQLWPVDMRWTCLMLDLEYMMSIYLKHCYHSLKSIKLCANMAVKNMFTTDLLLDPGISFNEAKLMGLTSSQGLGPIPREMAFPVPKGTSWHDLYDYIRFPSDGSKLPFFSIQKEKSKNEAECTNDDGSPVTEEHVKPVQDCMSRSKQFHRNQAVMVTSIPELGVVSKHQRDGSLSPNDDQHQQRSTCSSSHQDTLMAPIITGREVHVYAHPEEGSDELAEESEEFLCSNVPSPVHPLLSKGPTQKKLLPDPILKLNRIIGFGGATASCALWTKTGDAVVYPCHAIIVSLNVFSNQQRFFIGHTDKVSALAFNGNTTLLASAQMGNHSVVRVWNYQKGTCLSMFRIAAHSLSCLSFSYSGAILCGVGKDSKIKTMVVVWNTLKVREGGDVTILAKAHTDVDINTMKVTFFDDTRMVSCGWDNIRLWRVRNGTLRSCPVDLGEYRSIDFTDVTFEEQSSNPCLGNFTLYASSRNGYIFEIDYSRVVIKNIRRLQPAQQPQSNCREKPPFKTDAGIAINSISMSSSFCCTGSEDGFLRLWSLDFTNVFLEAQLEGPVSLVSVSSDNHLVLACSSAGIMGFLDVKSHSYNTLMRSHTETVLGFSVDGIRRHLTTASSDGTVRIWSMDSLHQLYDFVSDDCPGCVAFHPSEGHISCGFNSGIVRVFDISSAKLLAEHKQHSGRVMGLIFTPDGEFMYSADSQGSLVLYNAFDEDYNVIRVLYNVVAGGPERASDTLTVSSDSRCLAFVGPTQYIVTIADSKSLEELLHVDVSILDVHSPHLDSALKVCFSPASTEHLLVATSANKILWLSTKTGRLLREVPKVHRHQCSSLAVSEDGRFLLTAGHNAVKVWDYNMQLDVNSQMFIGHSQPICQVGFTPDQLGVISVGDAIFFWDFLPFPEESASDDSSSSVLSNRSASKTELKVVEPESELGESVLSNGVPRKLVPLPCSPPVDISTLDQLDHVAEETVPLSTSGSGVVAEPRPAPSFLKITVPDQTSPLTVRHSDKGTEPVRPDCYRHFISRFKTSTVDQAAVPPIPGEECIKLKAVIGYNGNGRDNMVWSPEQGLFAYTCGSVVVVEYLHTGRQRHLQGHHEEISCLAITHNTETMASASGGSHGARSLICIWNVQNGTCRTTLFHHSGEVQCLTFSSDDRFLLSAGGFSDPVVALWDSDTFQLLSSISVSGLIHDAAFSPSAANQLACVGSHGVYFCFVHACGSDVELRFQGVKAPAEVGDVELTALSYHADSLLFTATNRGHVCIWDVGTQHCFMTWEAEEGEIGVLLCRGNRLLSGSNSRWLRLWEVEAVKPQDSFSNVNQRRTKVVLEHEIMLDGATVSAAFDKTLDMGIIGTTAGTIWYINWSDYGNIRLVSGHKNRVNAVAFSPDEKYFATCSEDGSVRVWLVSSIELMVQFQVLSQACGSVCWSPSSSKDGACLAAGYSDGTLRIFRLSSSEMELKLHPHDGVAVTAIQYSANGHVILSAGQNGLVAVSSTVNGATVRVIRDHKGAPISTIQCVNQHCKTFGLEGNELWLAASADRRVSVWAADWLKDKCDLLDWLTFPAPSFLGDDAPPPSLAAFAPTDPSLVVYTGYGVEKELTFYSLVKKQIIKKISLPHWISCLSLSCKSQLIAVGSQERVVKMINWGSGRCQDFSQHSDSLQTCHFSPSGTLLFTVAFNEILLWDVRDL
ncbi:WD repeat-containing protein 90 isoform X2 [Takifugu rubripes]|uniref:WD repeat-containing protein 90 isoform X2 n=1 Tax=Takifugu rubripes TaxID=31033 RepID=UPI0011454D58|nr:WD repeat-containing protein 90 isoform X2 [Takifugu rubripes]